MNIITIILTSLLGIIGYFLVKTMMKIDKNETSTNKNTTDIALLVQDHNTKYTYLTNDFKDLKDSIKDLTKEIKELNAKIRP